MLPVYHELVGKFGEVLRLTQTGDVLAKTRISHGKYSLQPVVAPLDEHHAILALRHAVDQGGRVLQSTTADGGMTWTHPEPLTLPNPNAAIALLTLADDTLLMALNDTEDGRHRLSLALLTGPAPSNEPRPSSSHSPWRIVKTIESEDPASGSHEFEFSYPSLVHDEAGRIHLVYTWNQTRIKHIVFNRAWLSAHILHQILKLVPIMMGGSLQSASHQSGSLRTWFSLKGPTSSTGRVFLKGISNLMLIYSG